MATYGFQEEDQHRHEDRSQESPFSFLKTVDKATVDFVHYTILSGLTAMRKNEVVLACLKDSDKLDKFKDWMIKVMKRAPHERLKVWCDQNQRDDESWFLVAFEEATKILQAWTQCNDHHVEKRKGLSQDSKIDPKRLRMEENLYPQMENVSALHISMSPNAINQRAPPSAQEQSLYEINETRKSYSDMLQFGSTTMNKEEPLRRYSTDHNLSIEPRQDHNNKDAQTTHSQRTFAQTPIHHSQTDSQFTSTYNNDFGKGNHASRPVDHSPAGPRTRSKSNHARHEVDDLEADLKSSNPLYILLLGETGVGKTTVINSLANYVKYNALEEVITGEPIILVDTSFTTTSNKHRMVTVEAKANNGKNKNRRNEVLGSTGTSSTQDPMNHVIRWKENGVERVVVLIDTPGINDTRGEKQDEKNFEKILNHISKIGKLHAICILMKPNESKFTVGFRYCIDNLLVKLHRSATQNILFCFTNTRSTLYRPGDTLSTLHEYLKQLAKDTGVSIKADRTNIFCYDNDCFRFMCILRQFPSASTTSSMATFSEGWRHNVEEAAKMLVRVEGLSAHVVEDTVNINKTRRLVTAMARPLAEIARNHVLNMKMIEERIEEIERLKAQGRDIGSQLYKEQVVMELQQLPFPRTVCSSPRCNHLHKINDFEVQKVPLKPCHDNCHLRGIPEQSVNNPDLASCSAFRDDKCTVCGCHWSKHMHITYELVPRLEMVTDRNARSRYDTYSDSKKNAECFLKEQKEKLKMLENEHDQIRECCAEFAAFLSANSMKQTADPFLEYLSHLIDEEECKSAVGGNSAVMCELVSIYDDYEQRVKQIMQEIEHGHRRALTSSQLNNHIQSLSRLKHCGPTIAQLKDVQYLQCADIPDDHIKAAIDQTSQALSDDLKRMALNSTTSSSYSKRPNFRL